MSYLVKVISAFWTFWIFLITSVKISTSLPFSLTLMLSFTMLMSKFCRFSYYSYAQDYTRKLEKKTKKFGLCMLPVFVFNHNSILYFLVWELVRSYGNGGGRSDCHLLLRLSFFFITSAVIFILVKTLTTHFYQWTCT